MKHIEIGTGIVSGVITVGASVIVYAQGAVVGTGAGDISFSPAEIIVITAMLGVMASALAIYHRNFIGAKDDQIRDLKDRIEKQVTTIDKLLEAAESKELHTLESMQSMIMAFQKLLEELSIGQEAIRSRVHELGNALTPPLSKIEVHLEKGNQLLEILLKSQLDKGGTSNG